MRPIKDAERPCDARCAPSMAEESALAASPDATRPFDTGSAWMTAQDSFLPARNNTPGRGLNLERESQIALILSRIKPYSRLGHINSTEFSSPPQTVTSTDERDR